MNANAESVCATLSKAIRAVEAWHEAQSQLPQMAAAAEEMFLKIYPEREALIKGMRRP